MKSLKIRSKAGFLRLLLGVDDAEDLATFAAARFSASVFAVSVAFLFFLDIGSRPAVQTFEHIRQVSFSQRSGFVGGVGWLYECRLVSTYEVMGRDNCGKVIFQ